MCVVFVTGAEKRHVPLLFQSHSCCTLCFSLSFPHLSDPPTVIKLSSDPEPVKEGETLTLTCEASGGNPTTYTYLWYYNNKEVRDKTSKDYKITDIKYTQSGTYLCRAVNYSPDGTADASKQIDVLCK
jgi:hypothetical protein